MRNENRRTSEQYSRGRKRKGQMLQQRGFTLVEMMVVMVVLGILLSLSVSGLLAWQDWANFKQQNEYAQTLFIAAQNQLAEYDNTGRLERFEMGIQDRHGEYLRVLDVKKLTNGNGDAYPKDELVWYESLGETSKTEAAKYQGVLCYASCKEGDYADYLEHGLAGMSEEAKSRGADIVFSLLESYVYDSSILNAAISIEFSPDEGQVFAVCYSSRNWEFVYDAPNVIAPEGKVNIANREEEYRRAYMVGYYGTDTLAKATKDAGSKTKMAEVKLNNEETLNLSYRVVKPAGAIQALIYSIQVFDADLNRVILSFEIAGSDVHGYQARSAIRTPIIGYRYNEQGEGTPFTLGEYDVLAWVDENERMHVVLDAADIQANSKQYLADASLLYKENASATKFANTYSFHRFGTDAENIYCTVQASGSIYKNSAVKQTKVESAYYAKSQLEKTQNQTFGKTAEFAYDIENARHLYNVRFDEDLTTLQLNGLKNTVDENEAIAIRYEVKDVVDWNQFSKDGNLYESNAGILTRPDTATFETLKEPDGTSCAKLVTKVDFPSFKQLRYGDSFAGDDEIDQAHKTNDGTICNIGMSVKSNLYYDLYTLKDRGDGTQYAEESPIGLFIQNYGTIANLNVDQIKVQGKDKVGAFCGVNAGRLLGLEVRNSAEEESEISGQSNVGGIMGTLVYVDDRAIAGNASTNLELEALTNRARVSGCKYVGGIIGQLNVDAEGKIPQITVKKCKNYGALLAVNSEGVRTSANQLIKQTEPRYIGGIVGFCDNQYVDGSGKRDVSRLTISECESSPQYTQEDLARYMETNIQVDEEDLSDVLEEGFSGKYLQGVYVGGIVGYNNYAMISDCSTEPERNHTGYIFGYKYVGGIVGFNQGPASGILGSSGSDPGINALHVVGWQYVGGITGCNSDFVKQEQSGEAVKDAYQVIQPDKTTNYNVKIDNWVNEGIIFAGDSFAGGITGYNAGWIYNCNSRVKNSETRGFFAEAYSGDYAGGIAGYNNGIIGNTKRTIAADGQSSNVDDRNESKNRISTVCYISGDNYVGGIVGYNDVDAIVEDYALAGGHVRGSKDSCFVGGYAGFNSSILLLQDETGSAHYIESNPNEVNGHYFVGGTIGGNIVNTKNYKQAATTEEEKTTQEKTTEKPTTEEPFNPGEHNPDIIVITEDKWTETNNGKVEFNLKNSTNVYWNTWQIEIDLPENPTIHGTWNCKVQVKNNKLIVTPPNESWGSWYDTIEAGGLRNNIGFNVGFSSEAVLEQFIENTKCARISYNENVAPLGSAVLPRRGDANSNYAVEIQRTGQDEGKGWYNIIIQNKSGVNIENWSVVIEGVQGYISAESGSNVLVEYHDHTLTLTPNPNCDWAKVIGADGFNQYVGKITFDSPAHRDEVMDDSVKLYSNGQLIYSKDGNAPPSTQEPTTQATTQATTEDDRNKIVRINTQFKTDNFLGQMNGDAFVGGFVGYNALIQDQDTTAALTVEQKLIEQLMDSDAKKEALSDKVEIVDNILDTTRMKASKCELYVSGDGEDTETKNTLGMIKANIYVGGVFGYNDEGTALYVKNVKNTTPIVATKAISYAKEQPGRSVDYAGREMEYTYSYAGGVMGKVASNTTIDHCGNSSSGTVTSVATYTGGICEINEGLIKNCEVATFGTTVTDYVGGICGLNKRNGVVTDCIFDKKTITARNVAGGIAAENFGCVKDISSKKAKILVSGNEIQVDDKTTVDGVAGTIVAYNGATGLIRLSKDLEKVTIRSNGNYVGGVVGYNVGQVMNVKEDMQDIRLLIGEDSSITGRINVGGIMGYNANADTNAVVEKFASYATITATKGNAGGIIGRNVSNNTISQCENHGVIVASNGGNAGGITAENAGHIQGCSNFASVTAPKGMCGGIAASNKEAATIVAGFVGNVDSQNDYITFASLNTVGGIAAENAGEIRECSMRRVIVQNYSTSGESEIGVVTGINMPTGKVEFSSNLGAVVDSYAQTYTDYSKAGGVAGTNYGLITGAALNEQGLPTTMIEATVKFVENAGTIASFGGIAGVNKGTIQNISVQGKIGHDEAASAERLYGSDTTGYGGIAGVNGFFTQGENAGTAIIENCTFDGYVWAHGSGASIAHIGGIAGANQYDSIIRNCVLGVDDTTIPETRVFSGDIFAQREFATKRRTNINDGEAYTRNGKYLFRVAADGASYSYIGGIAGSNRGQILSCDNAKYSKSKVCVESAAGFNAGITGINHEGAVVTGTKAHHLTTGKNWKVEAYVSGNDIGTGGIISNNYSGHDMEYIDNYAVVKNQYNSNTNVGGLIGVHTQNESSSFKLSNCNNYGEVTSGSRAAGIVCLDMFKGINFIDCTNYANVYGIGASSYVAGMAAYVWNIATDASFINCINHGNLIRSSQENDCEMGGIMARRSGGAGSIILMNCVNTGIIRKYSDATTTTNLIAPDSKQRVAGIIGAATERVYIDSCRNYDNGENYGIAGGVPDTTIITNCLDVSGNTVASTKPTELLPLSYTAAATSSNNYYVAKQNSGQALQEGAGAYFGLSLSHPMKNTKMSNKITNYFATPDITKQVFNAQDNSNFVKMHFDVAYDAACDGMDQFVFYLGGTKTYKYTAIVKDSAGKTKTIDVENQNTIESGLESGDNKQVLDMRQYCSRGELSSTRIETIDLEITCTNPKGSNGVVLYGFQWVPTGKQSSENCTSMQAYLYKKYATAFSLSQTIDMNNISNAINDVYGVNFADYTYFNDETNINRLVVAQNVANDWQKYEFGVTYNDGAAGVDKFLFYLTTMNGKPTDTKENYAYYYVLNYKDGSTKTNGSKEQPYTVTAAQYHEKHELEIGDQQKKLDSIELYLRCTTSGRKYINMCGFKWIPIGENSPILLCSSAPGVLEAAKRELIVKPGANGAYDLVPAGSVLSPDAKISMSGTTKIGNGNTDSGFYSDLSDYQLIYDQQEHSWNTNSRIDLYKELDPKYIAFLCEYGYVADTKLAMPSGLKINSNTNGTYNFSWNTTSEPYCYQVYYTLSNMDDQVLYTSTVEDVMKSLACRKFDAARMNEEWARVNGTGDYKITFYVRAVSAYHRIHEGESDADKFDSKYASITQNAKTVLPQPKFHLEAIEGNRFVAVIENFEDFEAYKNDCRIKVTYDGCPKSYYVDMEGGYTEPFVLNTTAKNDIKQTAVAEAVNTSKYMNSPTQNYAGTLMGSSEYESDTVYQIPTEFVGFFGSTVEGLNYRVTYTANAKDFRTSADIIAMDEVLGVPIAYASGVVHTANRVTNTNVYITTTLTGFGDHLNGKDIEVRTYPYASQNQCCMYGHEVVNGIKLTSKQDVKAVEDPYYFTREGQRIRNAICEESATGELTLKPGYVIYDNQDAEGTYNIYYSASLAQYAGSSKPFQVQKMSYTVAKNAQGEFEIEEPGYQYYKTLLNEKTAKDNLWMQPAPVIEKSGYPKMEVKDGHQTYTFAWDQNQSGKLYEDATYSVELFGVTREEEEVSLKTLSVIKERSYTFVDYNNNWNYKALILKVERNGSVQQENKTVILPTIARETFTIKLRLSTIEMPNVVFGMDEDSQQFDKNNLCYDVTWGNLTDKDEVKDLAGYLITTYTLKENAPENSIEHADKKVSFYAPEKLSMEQWKAMKEQGTAIENEDVLTSRELVDNDYKHIGENCKAKIDLSGYRTGDLVYITITAIANPNAEIFRNSEDSDPAEVEIQERLKTPFAVGDGCTLVAIPSYDGDDAVAASKLNADGMELILTNPNATTSDNGQYEIAIAIYDEEGKQLQEQDAVAKAGSVAQLTKRSDWNQGSLRTLVNKANTNGTTMSGNHLASATYTVKIAGEQNLTDYAGMWMKIAVRAVTENKISSFWTDEDVEEEQTVNYQWIQIPKAQLEAPKLTIGTNTAAYEVEETMDEFYITRYSASFAEVSYADAYCVQLVGADASKPVTWLYLQKNAQNAYDIFYTSTKGDMRATAITDGCFANPNANLAVIDRLQEGSTIVLPVYQDDITILPKDTVKLPTSISLKNGVFTLELPDVSAVTDINGVKVKNGKDTLLVTGQIGVQALIKEENEHNYQNSKWMNSIYANKAYTKPIEVAQQDAPEILENAFTVATDTEQKVYDVSVRSDKNLVMQLLVADENNQLVALKYCRIQKTTNLSVDGFELPMEVVANQVTKNHLNYYVSFAQVTDRENLGKWTAQYQLCIAGNFVTLVESDNICKMNSMTLEQMKALMQQELEEQAAHEEIESNEESSGNSQNSEADQSTSVAPLPGQEATTEQATTQEVTSEQSTSEQSTSEQATSEQEPEEIPTTQEAFEQPALPEGQE